MSTNIREYVKFSFDVVRILATFYLNAPFKMGENVSNLQEKWI